MADLLFGGLGLMPGPVRRKARKFRLHDDFSLDEYSDEELRSRYGFGRDAIELLIDLLRDDLERATARNHALSTTVQSLLRCGFLPPEAFCKLLEIPLVCQSRPCLASSAKFPMPSHKNKYTSSSGHRTKPKLFKLNEAFTTREGSLG